MPIADRHSPGAFSWIELGTTDQNGAKRFYSSLLGWTVEDTPMGPNEYYTTFRLEGRAVGAAYSLGEQELAMHVPTHWAYILRPRARTRRRRKPGNWAGRCSPVLSMSRRMGGWL